MFKQIIVFAFLFHLSWAASEGETQKKDEYDDCDSKMFCFGDLLETIQLSEVNRDDSEKFVKMKTLHPPDDVWNNFVMLKEKIKDLKNNVEELGNFIKNNFDEDSLEKTDLTDYKEMEHLEETIQDKTYLEFYRQINPTWQDLGVKTRARPPNEDPNRYSMIELPKYFIKTGNSQSFPELWQNYLIVRGLLWNDMFDSALNIIKDLERLSKARNFVPLTNRVYAEKRHQLPLLSFIVEDYLQAYDQANDKYDIDFLQEIYPVVENELNWWIENAKAGLKKADETDYLLFKYKSFGKGPRPQKYKEDYNLAEKLPSPDEKIRFYSAVRALDGTAFGYSSRYLQNKKYPEPRMNLEVDRYVPVELNSVLQRCAYILSDWFSRLGLVESTKYLKISEDIQEGIDKFLWNEKHKMWLDYDLQTGQNVEAYYITNMVPLFTLSYNKDKYNPESGVLDYLVQEKIITVDDNSNYHFNYNVIPTTNSISGEISDKPYGSVFWNILIIDGLNEIENDKTKEVARQMAAALVKTIYIEYKYNDRKMLFENYKIDGPIEDNEVEKLNKDSSSTLGGLITLLTLLKRYGSEIKYAASKMGGISDANTSADPMSESNMSASEDLDFSFTPAEKRPAQPSTATNEDNPDSKTMDTSDGKRRKIEDEIKK